MEADINEVNEKVTNFAEILQSAETQRIEMVQQNSLRVCDLSEFLKIKLPPREEILSPWLLSQSINMLYAPRGIGKTQVALSIALAVATASDCMRWTAQTPRSVIYIDGEMPAITLQDRLAKFIAGIDKKCEPEMFRIVNPDLQQKAMPDLSTKFGQQEVTDIIGNSELVILDNLSCLVRGEKSENDAESWLAVQEWMLYLRTQGKSVLFLHHAGKAGTQRGTSKKEDILDCSIVLRRPEPYFPNMGCLFTVAFEKSRNLFGEAVEPFEAKLVTEQATNGTLAPTFVWKCDNATESLEARVISLREEGKTHREISQDTRTSLSKVTRILKATKLRSIKGGGKLQEKNPV